MSEALLTLSVLLWILALLAIAGQLPFLFWFRRVLRRHGTIDKVLVDALFMKVSWLVVAVTILVLRGQGIIDPLPPWGTFLLVFAFCLAVWITLLRMVNWLLFSSRTEKRRGDD